MPVKALSKSPRPIAYLRLAYCAPEPDRSTIKELHRLTMPATKALPFVKLRANDRPLLRPECFWNVEPTGKRKFDIQLGRQYAGEAIAAMKADHNSDLIALIIQDIINDTIERARKNGRARQSAVASGFLSEVSDVIAAAVASSGES